MFTRGGCRGKVKSAGFHAVTPFYSNLEAKCGAEVLAGFGAISVRVSGTDALGYVCYLFFSLMELWCWQQSIKSEVT